MKRLAILALAALALSGCTTAQVDSANKIANASVQQFCTYWPAAHQTFLVAVAASNGRIGPGSVRAEAQAAAAAQEFCANPGTDSKTAAIRAASILARFVAIEAAARKATGA